MAYQTNITDLIEISSRKGLVVKMEEGIYVAYDKNQNKTSLGTSDLSQACGFVLRNWRNKWKQSV